MICQCLADQLFDLLATDKSRYFVQPRPIIANYLSQTVIFFPSVNDVIYSQVS